MDMQKIFFGYGSGVKKIISSHLCTTAYLTRPTTHTFNCFYPVQPNL